MILSPEPVTNQVTWPLPHLLYFLRFRHLSLSSGLTSNVLSLDSGRSTLRQSDCNVIMDIMIIMMVIIWIFSSSNPTPWPFLSTGHQLHDHIWVPLPSPGIVSVPLCVCQTDHVKSSPPPIIVPRVVVVVVVHASVVSLVYVCSSLVWIDASPALCKKFEYIQPWRKWFGSHLEEHFLLSMTL